MRRRESSSSPSPAVVGLPPPPARFASASMRAVGSYARACTEAFTIAVAANGHAYGWGEHAFGQLGTLLNCSSSLRGVTLVLRDVENMFLCAVLCCACTCAVRRVLCVVCRVHRIGTNPRDADATLGLLPMPDPHQQSGRVQPSRRFRRLRRKSHLVPHRPSTYSHAVH